MRRRREERKTSSLPLFSPPPHSPATPSLFPRRPISSTLTLWNPGYWNTSYDDYGHFECVPKKLYQSKALSIYQKLIYFSNPIGGLNREGGLIERAAFTV